MQTLCSGISPVLSALIDVQYKHQEFQELERKNIYLIYTISPDKPFGFSSFSYRKCLFFSFFFPRTQWPSLPCRSQWAMLWLRSLWFLQPGRRTGREAPMGSGFLSRRRRRKHSWTSHPKAPCSGHADGRHCQHLTPLSTGGRFWWAGRFVNTEYLFGSLNFWNLRFLFQIESTQIQKAQMGILCIFVNILYCFIGLELAGG